MGDLTMDILVRSHGPISPGSDVEGEITLTGGGSAANFASWAAHLGMDVTLVTCTGKDWMGTHLCQELERNRVQLQVKRVSGAMTGSILLFVDAQGERHMITQRGANLALTAEDLCPSLFQQASHLHLTAYSFFGGAAVVQTALRALALAEEYSLSISLDPSSYALLREFGVERFLSLTAPCQILFPNLAEGRILTGYRDKEAVLQGLHGFYPLVLLKMGEEGVSFLHAGEVVHVKAENPHYCIDTTGAGDAFAAGFLSAYLREKDLLLACKEANALAGRAVQISGGRPPCHSR